MGPGSSPAVPALETLTERLRKGPDQFRAPTILGQRYLEPLPEPGSRIDGMWDRPWSGRGTPYPVLARSDEDLAASALFIQIPSVRFGFPVGMREA